MDRSVGARALSAFSTSATIREIVLLLDAFVTRMCNAASALIDPENTGSTQFARDRNVFAAGAPIGWDELPKLKSAARFHLGNIDARLAAASPYLEQASRLQTLDAERAHKL